MLTGSYPLNGTLMVLLQKVASVFKTVAQNTLSTASQRG